MIWNWVFPARPASGIARASELWSAAVVDAAVHVGPYIEVKGEYINTWQQTTDVGTIRPRGWWIQAGYKLAGLNLDMPFVSNVELVGRYDTSERRSWEQPLTASRPGSFITSRTRLLFEGDYEWLHSRGPNALPSNEFIFQLSYGF